MPKINQEEYELLKSLDDYWKWIARDNNGRLYKFQEKPKKVNSFQWNDRDQTWLGMSGDRFQFIQWEDEVPYNIAELIEDYEFENVLSDEERFHELYNANESEETEVKNIEELKSWFEDDKYYEGEYVNRKIDQLDEPEVLSREWVAEHEMPISWMAKEQKVVRVEHLQNLLVPKQEEQSAKTVADVVTTFWKSYERLKEVMSMEVEEMEE